jgi:DNA-binding MarR family transcriptional regulator
MTDLKLLFNELVRLEIELWDAVDARLQAELGVGAGTFQTLDVIARVEDCRVGDVVRELSITVGGASKTIDRLEQAGLCARTPHPSDRRSSVIALTREGERVRKRADKVVAAELEQRIGAVLSTRAIDQLGRTVARLRAVG